MAKYKTGDIVFVKTTGEQVSILSFDENAAVYRVRRPVMTKEDGIKHCADLFTEPELETLAEKYTSDVAREMHSFRVMDEVAKLTRPAQKEPAALVN